MLIVGLTGTSGAGKGYLCSYLEDDNVYIIDTDAVYHRMIEGPSDCTSALTAEFGEEIINAQGGIDRRRLASIVFSDKEKLLCLNKIAHAQILRRCRELINECSREIVIIDAPQLFESGFDRECDLTVAVTADIEVRIERIMKRDRIDYSSALKRINSQHSDSWFEKKCDIVIVNNDGSLKSKAEALLCELKRLYGEKKKKE